MMNNGMWLSYRCKIEVSLFFLHFTRRQREYRHVCGVRLSLDVCQLAVLYRQRRSSVCESLLLSSVN